MPSCFIFGPKGQIVLRIAERTVGPLGRDDPSRFDRPQALPWLARPEGLRPKDRNNFTIDRHISSATICRLCRYAASRY